MAPPRAGPALALHAPVMNRALRGILSICALLVTGAGPGGTVVYGQSATRPAVRRLLPSNLQVDEARAIAQRKAVLDWNTKILVGSYDRAGHHSPKWDDAARRGLMMTARVWAADPDRPPDAVEQAWYALSTAIKQGCDDPLVQYIEVEFSASDYLKLVTAHRTYAALIKLAPEPYHPYLVARAMVESASTLSDASAGLNRTEWEPRRQSMIVIINRAYDMLPQIFSDREMPVTQLVNFVSDLHDPWGRSGADRMQRWAELERDFRQVRAATDPVLDILRARMLADSAWDVRGSGWAKDVKPEAWTEFYRRLADAEAAAARAAATHVSDYAVVRVMNAVALGLHGDSDELEAWFTLGKRLAPGDTYPYQARLNSLQPRWLGASEYDVLNFARRMVDTGNWNLRLPMLMITAHEGLLCGCEEELRVEYFSNPLVCSDVLGVYEKYLERYPNSAWDRASYIKYLAGCGRWSDVKQQLKLIPADRLHVGAFGGQDAYDKIVRKAATVAR